MKVIDPYVITEGALLSSTVSEDDAPAWSAVTAYTATDVVVYAHKIYECLVANTGLHPDLHVAGITPKWLDLGATNRWKMFDQKVGTRTSTLGVIEVELAVGKVVPAVALLEIDGVSVTVSVTDPVEGEVYASTKNLLAPLSTPSWWNYFFEPISRSSIALFTDLPSYKNATITIEVRGGSVNEETQCGVCLLGVQKVFAKAVSYGVRLGIQDFSAKETDTFGNFVIIERSFAKRATWTFLLNNADLDSYQAFMASLRSKPVLYIGTDIYASTMIYGFFRDFETIISYPNQSECSVEIEGLI
jgi:hypothetical protein